MIFGFAATNFSKVYNKIKNNLKPSSVQFIINEDSIVSKRCYIALGLATLSPDRVEILNNKAGTLIIIDSLPSLRRVEDIIILDADSADDYWHITNYNFKSLIKELNGKPKDITLKIKKDITLSSMIEKVKNRSVLDKVLIAAKLIEPDSRSLLHKDVALLVAKKLSFSSFRKRSESRKMSGRKYNDMLAALEGPIAKRLSSALVEYLQGEKDAVHLSGKYDVEASEIRFISLHLEKKCK